jgi:hypothetical protein
MSGIVAHAELWLRDRELVAFRQTSSRPIALEGLFQAEQYGVICSQALVELICLEPTVKA